VRVVPVAETQEQGGVEVTLFSLEIYADGLLASLRLVLTDRVQLGDLQMNPFIMAGDDQDGHYSGYVDWLRWGLDLQWRLTAAFRPALPPGVRELRIEVPALRWQQADEEQVAGPWTFTVAHLPEEQS
jgi:hypothetical protein